MTSPQPRRAEIPAPLARPFPAAVCLGQTHTLPPDLARYRKPKPARVAIRLNGEPRFRGNRLSASG